MESSELYPFSLLEKYTNIEYHVKVFDVTEGDTTELEEIMKKSIENTELKIAYRKTTSFDRVGKILVHLEWFTYKKEKVSPFMAKMIINEGSIPV